MIFLDLHNAYEALDRSRYGVGPRAFRILHTYWRRLTMVTRANGYYGEEFKGARGVTQRDPISPIIFNLVVDAVVRNWVMVMVEGAEEQGEHEQDGRHHNTLFYADDGMVASSDP